jgi:hypothetical protein
MTSHYAKGSVTTLHEFGGVMGRCLNTFSWALTFSWSRPLAHVRSGPRTPPPPYIYSPNFRDLAISEAPLLERGGETQTAQVAKQGLIREWSRE